MTKSCNDIELNIKNHEDYLDKLNKSLDKFSIELISYYIKNKNNLKKLIPDNNTNMSDELFIQNNINQEQKNIINNLLHEKSKKNYLLQDYRMENRLRDFEVERLQELKKELEDKKKNDYLSSIYHGSK